MDLGNSNNEISDVQVPYQFIFTYCGKRAKSKNILRIYLFTSIFTISASVVRFLQPDFPQF